MKGKYSFLALICLMAFSCVTPTAMAQEAVSLKVAPLFFDFSIEPGEEKSGQIYVENDSDNDTKVSVQFSDFFIDSQGNYIFSEGKEVENGELKPYLMKDWLSTDSQEFDLKKGAGRLVKYAIRVPKDANLGGHYGAIFFQTECQKIQDENVVYSDQSSLCVSGRVGTLFLTTVGGEAVKKGEIERVDVPRLTFSDKANFSVAIKNTGNVHFRPEGVIDAKSITGNDVFHLDVKDKTLLPYRDYVLSGEILRSDGIGIYKLSGSIRDGEGNEMKLQKWVFLLPWKELVGVVVLVGMIYWFGRKFELKKIKN